jgi:hypothetical protein
MKELVDAGRGDSRLEGPPPARRPAPEGQAGRFCRPLPGQAAGSARKRHPRPAERHGRCRSWQPVPVSGVENAAYYYSTYNGPDQVAVSATAGRSWCWAAAPTASARASNSTIAACMPPWPSARRGYESIMVNCNPETVSTDYDTSDKLYFEPLTVEDVLSIYRKEKPEGVIVQFGGQTPLNIARELAEAGVPDPGHLAGNHRSGRGPRPFPADHAPPGHTPA